MLFEGGLCNQTNSYEVVDGQHEDVVCIYKTAPEVNLHHMYMLNTSIVLIYPVASVTTT